MKEARMAASPPAIVAEEQSASGTRHDRRARHGLVMCGGHRMQVFWRLPHDCHRAMIRCVCDRMRQFDMHASMRRIFHPPLHRKQVDAVGAKHDVVDAVQPTTVRGDGQRDGSVLDLPARIPTMAGQLADPLLDLRIQPMLRMRRLGKQWPTPRIFQRGQRVLAHDAVDVKVVGALEGFDCVEGVGAEAAVRR